MNFMVNKWSSFKTGANLNSNIVEHFSPIRIILILLIIILLLILLLLLLTYITYYLYKYMIFMICWWSIMMPCYIAFEEGTLWRSLKKFRSEELKSEEMKKVSQVRQHTYRKWDLLRVPTNGLLLLVFFCETDSCGRVFILWLCVVGVLLFSLRKRQ